SGDMRKHALAALGVIDGPASQISADGHSYHAWGRESIVRAPADQRQLIAQLHHGRPDVIEKLDFDHRLESASSHPRGTSDYVGLGQRRVKYAIRAESKVQSFGQIETPP